jgi:hypothetical protein
MSTKHLLEEGDAVLREILEANEDLGTRLATLPIWIYYEPDEDLFSLVLDKPQEALTEETDNGLYVRTDPETLKIVGFEIPRLNHRVRDDVAVAKLWEAAVGLVGASSSEPRPADQLARYLRKMLAVPAR